MAKSDEKITPPGHKFNTLITAIIKALGITVLAFLLSASLMAPFSASVSALFSTPEKNDFTISDFYNIVADSRAVSKLDDNIVVVNIDNSDRNEIAEIITIATLSGAKAVGLDVMFEDEREGDEGLINAINDCPVIIQPLVLRPLESNDTFSVKAASYYYSTQGADSTSYAAASMPSRYERSMIREMQVFFPDSLGNRIPSLPVAIAQKVAPEKAEKLISRNNRLETINYHSRRFRVFEPYELLDNADELTGRIVMIGAMSERGDIHQTPVNSSMPGILIHAYALSTILDGTYMNKTSQFVNKLIGFIFCFIIVFSNITLKGSIKGMLIRMLQVAMVWLVVQIGYRFFVIDNVIIDFSYAFLMLAFGFFACDVWNGFAGIGAWVMSRSKVKKLVTQLKSAINR